MCFGVFGIIVIGVEFEEFVLVLGGGVVIVNVDFVFLFILWWFLCGVLVVDDVDVLFIFCFLWLFFVKECEE